MEKYNEVKEHIKECENELKNIQSSRKNKSSVTHIYGKLKNLKNNISKEAESEDKQKLLKEIDELFFIIDSIMDYYLEETSEK